MSDQSISIVSTHSEYKGKEEKAKEILEWIISRNIFKPQLSDCVLSSSSGYAISEGAKLVSGEPNYYNFILLQMGLKS